MNDKIYYYFQYLVDDNKLCEKLKECMYNKEDDMIRRNKKQSSSNSRSSSSSSSSEINKNNKIKNNVMPPFRQFDNFQHMRDQMNYYYQTMFTANTNNTMNNPFYHHKFNPK